MRSRSVHARERGRGKKRRKTGWRRGGNNERILKSCRVLRDSVPRWKTSRFDGAKIVDVSLRWLVSNRSWNSTNLPSVYRETLPRKYLLMRHTRYIRIVHSNSESCYQWENNNSFSLVSYNLHLIVKAKIPRAVSTKLRPLWKQRKNLIYHRPQFLN